MESAKRSTGPAPGLTERHPPHVQPQLGSKQVPLPAALSAGTRPYIKRCGPLVGALAILAIWLEPAAELGIESECRGRQWF